MTDMEIIFLIAVVFYGVSLPLLVGIHMSSARNNHNG